LQCKALVNVGEFGLIETFGSLFTFDEFYGQPSNETLRNCAIAYCQKAIEISQYAAHLKTIQSYNRIKESSVVGSSHTPGKISLKKAFKMAVTQFNESALQVPIFYLILPSF